jgi:hypothetical protein
VNTAKAVKDQPRTTSPGQDSRQIDAQPQTVGLRSADVRFAGTGDTGWPVYDGRAIRNTREFGGCGALVTEPADASDRTRGPD